MPQVHRINKATGALSLAMSGTMGECKAKLDYLNNVPEERTDSFFAVYDDNGNLVSSTFSAGLPACGQTAYRKEYTRDVLRLGPLPVRKKKAA